MTDKVMITTGYLAKSSILWHVFLYRTINQDLLQWHSYSWDANLVGVWTKMEELRDGSVTLYVNESKHLLEAMVGLDNEMVAYLTVRSNSVQVTFASQADDMMTIFKALMWLQELYPKSALPTPTEVKMQFWTNSRSGATAVSRTIAVPAWDMIDQNYAQDTRAAIAHIIDGFRPAHGGQLMLWHGKPGTGKTFALRALSLGWRNWCNVECVIDPEAFFGDAAYMMQVLLDTENYVDEESPTTNGTAKADRWRLLILEDAGELLAEDARQRTGQGLSRMLNLADGLLGQGMQTLILVTTNEPLRTLHPAVARPGRCASEIEFKAFTPEEANTWLTDHKVDASSKGPQTLAQLYSQTEGFEVAQGAELAKLGFKAG